MIPHVLSCIYQLSKRRCYNEYDCSRGNECDEEQGVPCHRCVGPQDSNHTWCCMVDKAVTTARLCTHLKPDMIVRTKRKEGSDHVGWGGSYFRGSVTGALCQLARKMICSSLLVSRAIATFCFMKTFDIFLISPDTGKLTM